MNPAAQDRATVMAALRSFTFSFARMCFTCTCAVSSLIPSARGDLLVAHAFGNQLQRPRLPGRSGPAGTARSASRASTSGRIGRPPGVDFPHDADEVV